MPWWVIGLSAFGTAVDSGDYVGIVGGSYNLGLSQLAQWWLGHCRGLDRAQLLRHRADVPLGGFYQCRVAGVSLRGPSVRLLAVLINVQSRTNVLGNIFFSMFLGAATSSPDIEGDDVLVCGGGRGHQFGALHRARWPAGRCPDRRPAKHDHDRGFVRPVGIRVFGI